MDPCRSGETVIPQQLAVSLAYPSMDSIFVRSAKGHLGHPKSVEFEGVRTLANVATRYKQSPGLFIVPTGYTWCACAYIESSLVRVKTRSYTTGAPQSVAYNVYTHIYPI